jgi:hypothetical protein
MKGNSNPLKLTPKQPDPATWAAVKQTLVALTVIFPHPIPSTNTLSLTVLSLAQDVGHLRGSSFA